MIIAPIQQRCLAAKQPADSISAVRDLFTISNDDLTRYDAVRKLLSTIVLVSGCRQVVTGLTIRNPQPAGGLAGGFQEAGPIHLRDMAILVGFQLMHSALSSLVPRTLWAMIVGGAIDRRTAKL